MDMSQHNSDAVEEFERRIRRAMRMTVKVLAFESTEGLTADQLRERLDGIAQWVRLEDRAYELVQSYADGPDTRDAALCLIRQLHCEIVSGNDRDAEL
jgi:hypothetical protein